ncbi:MAG: pilus assembly protein [Glaciihabitans sp.]|nr:pilus assembly protein [Glaciihabitans sp.]
MVEFILVTAILSTLTLGVIQLALVLHIRNTLLDAAAEGARYAALADRTPEDGAARSRDLVTVALGAGFAEDIRSSAGMYLGHPSVIVTITAPLPLIGPIGPGDGIEVVGHASRENID